MSHSRLLSSLLLGLLLGRGAVAAGQPLPEPEPPRLSGTIIISDTVRRAIVCDADGNSQVLGIGDRLVGWGTITTIEPDRVTIETPRGTEAVVLSGGGFLFRSSPKAASSPTKRPAEAAPEGNAVAPPLFNENVNAGPEAIEGIERLVASQGSDRDLGDFLEKILDLPPSVRITAVDQRPLTGNGEALKHLRDALSHGNVVRLSVEGEGIGSHRGIYLFPGQQEATLSERDLRQ